MLLTKVAKIDMPIAHAGSLPPPVVKSEALRFLKEKEIPNPTIASIYTKKMAKSKIGMFGWVIVGFCRKSVGDGFRYFFFYKEVLFMKRFLFLFAIGKKWWG